MEFQNFLIRSTIGSSTHESYSNVKLSSILYRGPKTQFIIQIVSALIPTLFFNVEGLSPKVKIFSAYEQKKGHVVKNLI